MGFFLNRERKILFNHAKLQHDGTDTKPAELYKLPETKPTDKETSLETEAGEYKNSRRQSKTVKKHSNFRLITRRSPDS